MTARRPLLTAAAAGSVLFALWFVPSANATAEHDGVTAAAPRAAAAPAGRQLADRAVEQTRDAGDRSATTTAHDGAAADPAPHFLADTGSPDTTPYVIGGTACLALGAGLVSYSVRRTRDGSL
ncbi:MULTISPECIES: hypothetical protein [Streptomyces]|uniref:hypothetical protein n=1 Tax=Streptomyces TaxID=1883 RepID=UPI0020C015EB|nr:MULTISPECIES: hypothetical protein [Streptomyces]MCL6297591.1 hypothetical protein [Streptomyces kronopolitis]GLW16296.1 hypothetical protein Stsp01_30390 [Streptomyces sp. NBRC 13847]